MLTVSVLLYVLLSVIIGIYASKRVKNANDYMLAGKSLPMSLATTALFATWFGSETIMGAGATFAESGLRGVIEDPFGAFLALFLVGVVFAKHIYRLNIITLSDLFKNRYGEGIEIISAIMMLLSLLGWIAGQFLGLGILVHVIFGVELMTSIIICAIIVTVYTVFGGMWSVALVDFIQTIVIVLGLILFALQLHFDVAPLGEMIDAAPEGWFQFFPNANLQDWLIFIAAWITLGFGAIPSQDIFQRVLSSKNEKVAMRSSVIGAFMYLIIGMFPLIIALYARHFLNLESYGGDTQLLLPNLVLQYASPFVQIIFMGALISAILSTASGVILASATVISENIVKPLKPSISDKQFLLSLRISVVAVALVALYMALSNGNIFELVAESSSFGLVSLFVPMVAAIWIKQSRGWGAILSMVLGLAAYFLLDSEDAFIPIQLTGLAWSCIGMIVGSVVQTSYDKRKSLVRKS
jgi:SSS family solute:Na+ symporter